LVIGIAAAPCAHATDIKSSRDASKMMPVPPSPVSPTATTTARGEVKTVARGAGTITIQHGPLAGLQMAAGTSVFPVRDRALLEQVKAGDKITFRVSNADGL